MKKQATRFSLFCLIALTSSACFVQSTNPFFTKESQTKVPEIAGAWIMIKSAGDDVSAKKISPWKFNEGKIETFDDKNHRGLIDVSYTRINDTLFADFSPGEAEENNINQYWACLVFPVHVVCKVVISGDSLKLIPIKYDRLIELIKQKKTNLDFVNVSDKDDVFLFTCGSDKWARFLKDYAKDKSVFDEDTVFLFKRGEKNK